MSRIFSNKLPDFNPTFCPWINWTIGTGSKKIISSKLWKTIFDLRLYRYFGHSEKCWNQAIQWKKIWISFLSSICTKDPSLGIPQKWDSMDFTWPYFGKLLLPNSFKPCRLRSNSTNIVLWDPHPIIRAPPWNNFCPIRNIVFFYLVTHLSGMSQAMAKRKTTLWLTRNILKTRFIFTHQRLSFSNKILFSLFTLIFRLSSAVFPLFFNSNSLNSLVANAILRFVHSSLPAAAYTTHTEYIHQGFCFGMNKH